ncbi:MAG: DUF3520 domain-containing protein [Pedobacter sp.]|nr:MAG: DUF3520 domain-containing protein [Pedobacter sp.]
MKKLFAILIILLSLSAFEETNAQTRTITGRITDKKTGDAMKGAVVAASLAGQPLKVVATADENGKYSATIPLEIKQLTYAYVSYESIIIKLGKSNLINVALTQQQNTLSDQVVIRGHASRETEVRNVPIAQVEQLLQGRVAGLNIQNNSGVQGIHGTIKIKAPIATESYASVSENKFRNVVQSPLSTFSIDVDAAAYSNVRRFINNGSLPPADAVRIEEMVNYFEYQNELPTGKDPISIKTEIANAPWNTNHKLVKIGLQAKKVSTANLPASNLVFLIDVSGSMNQPNKLPLLVSSFKLLTDQLRTEDKVAIVVYAGNAGVVLPATSGNEKIKIKEALNQLSAGGSTAGGQGIELAYKIAAANFVKGGNNRILLATDGDFNVGASEDKDMEKLIEEKRKSGIFLTVLGYGMGNYKDSKMETLANKGNGNYAYIDNITEARKVLISEFGGTIFTVAKDVKLQVEFNPAKAQAYRLIGYENRMLKSKDFNDDQKDAGEMGSGHTVTAFYEVIPVGIKSTFSGSVDDLKYQANTVKPVVTRGNSNELMTVKLRYKLPEGSSSKLMEKPILDNGIAFSKTSSDFRFAAAVAEFGMLLRKSDFIQNASFDHVIGTAQEAKGEDHEGYRAEFIRLAKSAKVLAKDLLTIEQTKKPDEKN